MILLNYSTEPFNPFLMLYILAPFLWIVISKWIIKSSIKESFKEMEMEKEKLKEKLKEKGL
jgi:Tfp pilus assembly protein PilO